MLGKNNTKEYDLIKNFLLENSDSFDLTNPKTLLWHSLFRFKIVGSDKDERFKELLEKYKNELISKTTNNIRFFDCPQHSNQEFDHYLFRLTPRMKESFLEEGIILKFLCDSKNFYALEDPVFYNKGKAIGYVISHDSEITILDEKSADYLMKKGVHFDYIDGEAQFCNK